MAFSGEWITATYVGLIFLMKADRARDSGSLKAAGLQAAVFSAIRSNPVDSNVEAGVAAMRAGLHDGVIAFGGGSALDVGKVIAFMSGQTRPLWDFEDVGD